MGLVSEFKRSVNIMDRLRGDGGCPWDKEQTVNTLKKYIIEEAHELVEALESRKRKDIVEELGDLFFQVLFQARIGREKGAFSLKDVFRGLNEKMTRRHPHVFGSLKGKVNSSKEVLSNWAGSKKKEGKKSVLQGVPKRMPSLLRAYRVTEKAAGVGFDWRNSKEIVDKLLEEIEEFKKENIKKRKNRGALENEIGDMLFTAVNLSRFLNIDPDYSLRKTIDKFHRRFHYIEKKLKKEGVDIRSAGIDKMDKLWNEGKKKGI